ncbi:hypothetical protein DXT88_01795 [Herbaspirillum lusitanum]|uniref:WbqC family protein n=1 Tax=Herbaspirillum lusitanum TaxID=213312 RepID=UPI002238302A|nr:WbqC family protein [Herbaspirillum lusitanum]MCW5296902.1 hypothetical protein [Herbaspirillum lusitanum]
MNKTVVIHQPDFIPYLGFFHRFLSSELYLVLDHVQFVNGTSRAWTHRDKIKTPKGAQWLSVSVQKAPRDTPINQIEISTVVNWRAENLRLLEANYRTAPYYEEIMPYLRELYGTSDTMLADFNLRSIQMLMSLLDVVRPMIFSSALSPQGTKNELLIDLLKKVDATRYLSGVGARDYMDETLFHQAGIEVVWQNFQHPVYPQLHGDFEPYLSSVDALFNCGIDGSRRLLRGKQ